jgi:hypothetical protein
MDFDDLLVRFFGTADIGALDAERLNAGIDQLQVHFGMERDQGRRFALWCLMYMLGVAPELDVAFEDADDREAARDFMDMIDQEADED